MSTPQDQTAKPDNPVRDTAEITAIPATEAPAKASDSNGLLPILPVRNAVLFPGMVLPLSIGRTSSKKLLEDHQQKNGVIAIFTQREEDVEEPTAKDLYSVGVTAKVLRSQKQEEDNLVIIVNVLDRVRMGHERPLAPYLRAEVHVLKSTDHKRSDEWEAKISTLRDTALRLLGHRQDVPEQVGVYIRNLDDAGRLTDFIAGGLDFATPEKQALLEELDVAKRLRSVQAKIAHQLHVADLQDKIQKDVQSQFNDAQRRAYLHEQMKAIQKELGEAEGESEDQPAKLRERLAEAKPPPAVMEQAERELRRLAAIPPQSAEYSVITSYLDTLASLPWRVESKDNLDLRRAQRILDADHFGLQKVKRRLVEHLAVRKLKPDGHSPILLLLGPPGVGKTSLGQSVARALGRKFVRVSLGGMHDEADIRGHRRTYVGAMPGRLMEEIRRAGTKNPVVLLDEVDKIGRDFRGDPAHALLEVLDPHQNHTFQDHYLDVPFDLSKVLFIATANDPSTIPGPLLDRLEMIELSSYTEREKREIARRYIVKRQLSEHGLTAKKCEFPAESTAKIIHDYTREAGVRELERQVGSVCRAVAALIAGGSRRRVKVTPEFVESTLGPARFSYEEKNELAQPGVVTGLAWTPVGGEILHIEALKFDGTGQQKLTGQLGEVMKESVSAAVSLVRSRSRKLGMTAVTFKETDIHLHVPAGAVPKDGPSAGVAMFTALASLFSGKPVRADVAMTGEISLRGLVLPIGGLREKSLAALRAGIHTVIAPRGNKKDLAEIPEEVRKKLTFVWVTNVDEVLREALAAGRKHAAAAKPGAVRKSGPSTAPGGIHPQHHRRRR